MHYQKIFAAMTAACLLLSGCQKTPADSPAEEITAETLAQPADNLPDTTPLTGIVRCEPVALPDTLESIWMTERQADGLTAIGYTTDAQEIVLHISADLQTVETAVLTPPAGEGDFFLSQRFYALENGNIWALAVLESHGGMKRFDPETDQNNYDWDAWENSCEYQYLLCRYADNGTLVSAISADGLADYQNQQGGYRYNPFHALSCAGGQLYLSLDNKSILRIDKETGAVQEVIAPEVQDGYSYGFNSLFSDRDGRVLRHCFGADVDADSMMYSYSTSVCEFDPQAGEDGAELYRFSDYTDSANQGFVPGFGDYRFCITGTDRLIGIRDDGTQEPLIDWDGSDLLSMDVTPLDETQFFAYQYDDGKVAAYRLVRKHESEIQEVQTLTIGVFGDVQGSSPLYAFVKKFNREHDGYRVEIADHPYESVEDIEQTQENYVRALDEFKLSLLTDSAPDLVLINDHRDLVSLGKRGAFLDLNTLMASDALFNRNTLVPNVVTALESPEGGLYGLPTVFSVETIAAKTKICDKESWTLDDMIALYDSADHDVYRWQTKKQAFSLLLNGIAFVDEQNGTCRFDSPEFVQVLEFANRFPADLNAPVKDYESREAMEQLEKYYMDEFMSYSRDEQYLGPCSLSDGKGMMACGYSYVKYHTFGGEEITFVGYPSDNGQGGKIGIYDEIAVTSLCKQPQLAWEFLKSYVQRSEPDTSGFSIVDARFEEELDECMHITDFDGKELPYYEDDGMKVYPLTQAERDRQEQYIRSCTTLMPGAKDTVWTIAQEEAEKYFAGDQTAAEAGRMIQRRVELMIAEQS